MSKKIQRKTLLAWRGPLNTIFKKVVALAALTVGIFYGALFTVSVVPNSANTGDGLMYRVKVNPQSSLSSIAQQLKGQGLEINTLLFQLSARSLWVGSKLKPGTYLLPINASLGKVLLQITRGDRVRESIAIIPGMNIWQLRAQMNSHGAVIHQTKGMTSKELLQSLNLKYPSDEGIFLPDTYVFDPDDLDVNIYRRAAQATN